MYKQYQQVLHVKAKILRNSKYPLDY